MATGVYINTLLVSLPLLLVYLISGAESIMCYQCNSVVDAGCESLQSNESRGSPYYLPCDEHSESTVVFCRKIIQQVKNVENTVRVIRRCGWERHADNKPCYWFEDDDHKETVCQCSQDGCNGTLATHTHAHALTLLCALLLFPVVARLLVTT